MLAIFLSLLSGFIFSLGLVISGMTNPDKVIGFLDIFGQWDASLVFVMGGAVGFNFITFKILQKRKPICAVEHFLPSNTNLTKRLFVGSAIFGIGWGILGICPGPALVNLTFLNPSIFIFIGSMLIGMILYQFIESKL